MYAARCDIHSEFCSLVRFAPVAINSGLRPETRISASCNKFHCLAATFKVLQIFAPAFTDLQIGRKTGDGYALWRLRWGVEWASRLKIRVL